jgi:hypothetical protein
MLTLPASNPGRGPDTGEWCGGRRIADGERDRQRLAVARLTRGTCELDCHTMIDNTLCLITSQRQHGQQGHERTGRKHSHRG